MIKSLTPYYLTIPMVSPLTGLTCTQYTVKVYVWDGAKTAAPTTADFTITKDNATASTGNVDINIGFMVNSLLTFAKQEGSGTELIDGANQKWVKWNVYYTTSSELDALIPSTLGVTLIVKGYGYGMDGKNPDTPSNLNVISSGTEYRVARDGYFIVPIELPETTTAASTITIDSVTNLFSSVFQIGWSTTGTVTDVFWQYRLQPSTTWLYGGIMEYPYSIILPTDVGTYDLRLGGFDIVNNAIVYSATDTATVT